LKRVLLVFIVVVAMIAAYIGAYHYLKIGGIKILQDDSNSITKQSDTYLHYKVLNQKLLQDYLIDFRVLIDANIKNPEIYAKKELKNIKKHPRKLGAAKYAKTFVFVLVNPKDKTAIVKSSSKYISNNIFIKANKSTLKKYIISLEEALLDYKWKQKLHKN